MAKNNKKQYFVADDGGVYNAFGYDMFDEHGWLIGYEGILCYHIDDYDIVKEFDTFEQAVSYAERLNDEQEYSD